MSKKPLKESRKPRRSFLVERDDKLALHTRPFYLRHPYKLRSVPKYIDPLRFFDYQRVFNFAIIKHLPKILKNPSLLIPNAHYQKLEHIPFETIHDMGYQAIIFDKDNTLTLPLEYRIFGDGYRKFGLSNIIELFDGNVAILSNTLGNLRDNYEDDYDIPELMSMFPEFEWDQLEHIQFLQICERREEIRAKWRLEMSKTGRKVRLFHNIPIIIHNCPKPDVFEEIMDHFDDMTKLTRVVPGEIIFIGDRILTDVVLGNLHGMYTVLVDPIDPTKDNFAVRFGRKFEWFLYRTVVNFHKLNSAYTRTKWENFKEQLKFSWDLTLYRLKRIFYPRSPAYTPKKEAPIEDVIRSKMNKNFEEEIKIYTEEDNLVYNMAVQNLQIEALFKKAQEEADKRKKEEEENKNEENKNEENSADKTENNEKEEKSGDKKEN